MNSNFTWEDAWIVENGTPIPRYGVFTPSDYFESGWTAKALNIICERCGIPFGSHYFCP